MKNKPSIVLISDCHLGARHNNKEMLLKFLKGIKPNILILNGDFIDGWRLQKNGLKYLDKTDIKIFKTILKLSQDSDVYWVRGNHDEFLWEMRDERVGKIHFVEQLVINETLIIHGDQFDLFSLPQSKWLAKMGGLGYGLLLWANRPFKKLFKISLSSIIKRKVKRVVSFVNSFEEAATKKAKDLSCNSVICGHIHTPTIKEINGIKYINSGDWQESSDYVIWDDGWKLKKFE